jgi:sugar-specific transcriptional regulator TrmB
MVAILSVEEKDVAALQRLGLTEYESRLYLALAKMGPIKASEVSFHGHVPRTKSYGAIRELERKGLLITIPGKPEVYAARAPAEVLMPLITRLEGDVKESANLVQRLSMTYESNIIVRSQFPREAREMWIIEGRANVLNKMNELFNQASKTINYSTGGNGLIRAYKANADTLAKAKQRGVSVKMLTTVSSENASVASEMGSVLELRSMEKPFPPQYVNFASVDSHELIIAEVKPDDLSTDRGSDLAVWNRNKLAIGVHDQAFERLWDLCAKPAKK